MSIIAFSAPSTTVSPKKDTHFSAEILTNACREGIINERVFALGGITPELLPQLQEWGFGGAVMLGYLWEEKSPEKMQSRMSKLTFSSPT